MANILLNAVLTRTCGSLRNRLLGRSETYEPARARPGITTQTGWTPTRTGDPTQNRGPHTHRKPRSPPIEGVQLEVADRLCKDLQIGAVFAEHLRGTGMSEAELLAPDLEYAPRRSGPLPTADLSSWQPWPTGRPIRQRGSTDEVRTTLQHHPHRTARAGGRCRGRSRRGPRERTWSGDNGGIGEEFPATRSRWSGLGSRVRRARSRGGPPGNEGPSSVRLPSGSPSHQGRVT
jgi:hypothetical protein